jgi:5,10-methylenetetrahydromethanopterin reductase
MSDAPPPLFSIMPGYEFGIAGVAEAEQQGWGIATFGDSQIKNVDPYVRAAASIAITKDVLFRISVTNPVTRDTSVTAAAAATLQQESGGRLVLGIGAGYTALSLIGLPYPAKFDVFSSYVKEVRSYLHGETVERDGLPTRLRWLDPSIAPVPIDLTASGPRGLRLAGEIADWVTLAVGANPVAVEAALALVREGAERAGRDFDALTIGVHVPTSVDEDSQFAINEIRNTSATMAGFGVMARPGATPTGLTAESAQLLRDRMKIVREDQLHLKKALDLELGDEFVRSFALAGTAAEVIGRIAELHGMGISFFNVVFGSDYADKDKMAISRHNFEAGVMRPILSGAAQSVNAA